MAMMTARGEDKAQKAKYDPRKYTAKQILAFEKRDAEEAAKKKETPVDGDSQETRSTGKPETTQTTEQAQKAPVSPSQPAGNNSSK
jgi:hypothetical protein